MLAGCGDEDDAATSGENAASEAASPLYAMMVQVYDTEDRTVYVYLSKTLDLESELDLSQAREFPGVANFAPVGGRLLISSGNEPTITAFDISESLGWSERDSVSFSEFPTGDNANFYAQFILDDHTAYLPFEDTKRIIWDPTDMSITGTREDTMLEVTKGGLTARAGGNRNAIRFKGPVQQAFFYTDDDYFETAPESLVAIYDASTHEEKAALSLPCPGLSMASQDEDGNTYYSTWGFQGSRALFGEGAKPCAARLTPDLTVDESWTTDFTDLTEGRLVNNFRYIGKGKAIANVLHSEELDFDWDGEYDPDVEDAISKTGDHWRLWLFDLDEREAKPIDGVDVALGSGAQFAVLDGRTFVFVPYDEWARSKIYELDDEGRATLRSDTTGDVFKWVKVR